MFDTCEALARGEKLLQSAVEAENNEALATVQLRLMLTTGHFAEVCNVPNVESFVFEYRIAGFGVADLAVFHPGGGLTLVEAKGPEPCRAVAAGIGQLFMYEAGARLQLKRQGIPPPFVNRVLCAPIAPEVAQPVWEACQIAGVRFVHLSPLASFKEIVANSAAKRRALNA